MANENMFLNSRWFMLNVHSIVLLIVYLVSFWT